MMKYLCCTAGMVGSFKPCFSITSWSFLSSPSVILFLRPKDLLWVSFWRPLCWLASPLSASSRLLSRTATMSRQEAGEPSLVTVSLAPCRSRSSWGAFSFRLSMLCLIRDSLQRQSCRTKESVEEVAWTPDMSSSTLRSEMRNWSSARAAASLFWTCCRSWSRLALCVSTSLVRRKHSPGSRSLDSGSSRDNWSNSLWMLSWSSFGETRQSFVLINHENTYQDLFPFD